MFNYGSFKLFLTKISIGIILICFSVFLIVSILTYNTNDPGIGKLSGNIEILNFFGFWGAIFSSVFLILFGKLSLIFIIFLLYSGFLLSLGFKSKLYLIKLLLVTFSSILINFSLVLHDLKFFETGLISKILFDIFSYYLPVTISSFFYKLIISFLLIITSITLLMFCFSLKLKILNKIFLKVFNIILSVFIKSSKVIKVPLSRKNYIKENKVRSKNEPTILRKTKNFKSGNTLRKVDPSIKVAENEFTFNLPTTDLLIKSRTKNAHRKEVENLNKINSSKLEKVLSEYGVIGKVIGFKTGPIVTLYEFIPSAGIKASKVIGLSDDIARAMSSVSARISSQPGKTSLGIEIPNLKRDSVCFGDLVEGSRFEEKNNSLTLALGKDISGQLVYTDLEKMPHLLIAGTTGSGKSVGINTIIMSILYRFKPDECKLILIDPKMLELSIYEDIPHLLTPVVTNPNKAVFALKWVVREMENRYKLMSSLNVKSINSYNDKSKKILATGKKLYKNVQTGIDDRTRQPIF